MNSWKSNPTLTSQEEDIIVNMETIETIKSLKNGKAAGSGEINAELLKNGSQNFL